MVNYERVRRFFFWVGVGIATGFVLIGIISLASGCQRGDLRVSTVLEGQAAPHSGWNFGPDSWVEAGELVKVGGVVVWVQGLDPNGLFGNRAESK